ncbi:MAG: ABC transporter ATP-binding protein [Dehalococcoidales bacterium]|jgi:ABC-type multidrug transport system fused ATPase/permease subunit
MKAQRKTDAVWFFLKRYKRIYITMLFVTIGYSVLESANISMFLPLFTSVMGEGEPAGKLFVALDRIISFLPFQDRFVNACVLIVVILVVKEALGFARHYLIGYGVGKVTTDVKEEIFNKYVASDYQFFLDNKQGRLIYNMLTATGRLGNCLQFVPDLITALLMTLTIGALLFTISFKVTMLLLFVGLGFNMMTQVLARRVSYHIGTERATVSTKANVIANEVIDGIKHIKVFGSSDFWKLSFEKSVRRFRELVITDFMWIGVPERFMQLLPAAALIVVAVFFKYFKGTSGDAIGSQVALMGIYIYAFYRLIPYLTSFGRLRMQIMGALPEVEILYDELHQDTNQIKDGDKEIKEFRKELRFEDVGFNYKGKKELLEGISFVIEKGKTTAIVGASGSGKTTLINLIVRLFVPEKGRIAMDGTSLNDVKYSSLIGLVGMVSQDTFIFNATIRENIVFGLKDVAQEKLVEACKLANAHEFISMFPDGYDTVVGDKGLKLSGGQRQRIAIARAIIRDPQILILDEATSSLDYHSEAIVQEAINEVSKNRTVIVVAHRLSTVIDADKIIVMDKGSVVEQGTHAGLVNRNGVYRALYERQQKTI